LNSVEQIVEEQALGILNLRLNQFKEAVLPTATDLLSVVENTIPRYVPSIYISVVLLGVTTVYVLELYTSMCFSGYIIFYSSIEYFHISSCGMHITTFQ
jgi:hypothetical protein